MEERKCEVEGVVETEVAAVLVEDTTTTNKLKLLSCTHSPHPTTNRNTCAEIGVYTGCPRRKGQYSGRSQYWSF
jgi:hypothetical protein